MTNNEILAAAHEVRKERRPVRPERVLRFKFNDDDGTVCQEVLHWPNQLSKVEWLQRASVRLLAGSTSDGLPPLTPWAPPPNVATSRPIITQIRIPDEAGVGHFGVSWDQTMTRVMGLTTFHRSHGF